MRVDMLQNALFVAWGKNLVISRILSWCKWQDSNAVLPAEELSENVIILYSLGVHYKYTLIPVLLYFARALLIPL